MAILALSVALLVYFFRLLPPEVAYHFEGGAPDRWMGRGALVLWLILPQLLFVLMAAGIVWAVAQMGARFPKPVSAALKRLLSIMGNMVALPQAILSFAMLDIFLYNAYQARLMPLWVFAAVVMGLGGIIIGIYFALVIMELRGQRGAGTKERS